MPETCQGSLVHLKCGVADGWPEARYLRTPETRMSCPVQVVTPLAASQKVGAEEQTPQLILGMSWQVLLPS